MAGKNFRLHGSWQVCVYVLLVEAGEIEGVVSGKRAQTTRCGPPGPAAENGPSMMDDGWTNSSQTS